MKCVFRSACNAHAVSAAQRFSLNLPLCAEGTLERALAGVNLDMAIQIVTMKKRSLAVGARKHSPGLCHGPGPFLGAAASHTDGGSFSNLHYLNLGPYSKSSDGLGKQFTDPSTCPF